jgi:malonyl CoA-acyl carrier protein transacylase
MKQAATKVGQLRARRRRRRTVHRHGTLQLRWRQSARKAPLPSDESTLLQLVQEVQKRVRNDAEVVRIVRWLVNSGAVVLTGSFAGRHF